MLCNRYVSIGTFFDDTTLRNFITTPSFNLRTFPVFSSLLFHFVNFFPALEVFVDPRHTADVNIVVRTYDYEYIVYYINHNHNYLYRSRLGSIARRDPVVTKIRGWNHSAFPSPLFFRCFSHLSCIINC